MRPAVSSRRPRPSCLKLLVLAVTPQFAKFPQIDSNGGTVPSTGAMHANLRIHLPGMSARVRSAGVWPRQSQVPKVRKQKIKSAAQCIRHFGQGLDERASFQRGLWFVRRPARPRSLLAWRPRLTSRHWMPPPCSINFRHSPSVTVVTFVSSLSAPNMR